MCGICGVYNSDGQAAAELPLVKRMAGTLEDRGPDGDGFHVSPHVVLGHRRLKIIDLSPLAAQPMSNEDGTVWISFNGEIYNYLELRPQLTRSGHIFRSQSDTEVMVHLYEEEGDAFLERLNGMFALALLDERRERLLLARDRFGKKPLYYFFNRRRLLFGSELKAILADDSVPCEIDPEAVSLYLTLGYIPCPLTIFKGIYKLPPASRLVVERGEKGTLQLRGPERYWQLRYNEDSRLTEDDCVQRIQELVQDAVRIRMYSDVPLGAFLSGGLDSSTVVAAMANVADRPVETFSIGFDQESHDELAYAELVAKHLGTHHHTLRCKPDALEVLPTLVRHYDEPFADSSAVPTYYVSKIARQFVTVALSGDGGDEVFGGYTRYDSGIRRWRLAQWPAAGMFRGALGFLSGLYPTKLRGWGILYRHSLPPLESYVSDISIYQPVQRHAILKGKLEKGNGLPERLFGEVARQTGSPDFISQMQYIDQMLYLPDDILVKVDRASMAVSLETRAPLLDYRLAEFLATVPSALRYRQETKKYLLKKAVSGRLPDQIIHRRKMGFGVPLTHWFRNEAGDFARDVLLSQRARERGFFQTSEVEELLDGHQARGRDFAAKIWALLFFELWCQAWLDRRAAVKVSE